MRFMPKGNRTVDKCQYLTPVCLVRFLLSEYCENGLRNVDVDVRITGFNLYKLLFYEIHDEIHRCVSSFLEPQ